MARDGGTTAVTPGQAQWIVERLIADRRISRADVRGMLSGMSDEIADLEHRLATLRDVTGSASSSPQNARTPPPARKAGKRGRDLAGARLVGHTRGIAGTLVVLLRSIPAAEHAAIQAIRGDKGIPAAIKAAHAAVKT